MQPKEHFTLRLTSDTMRRLVRRSEQFGEAKTVLAGQFLQEGLRMAEHPGIVFRDGPAGRRPGIAGLGLDVWEIIETLQNEDRDARAVAAYLQVSQSVVSIALDYYLDYQDEIDRWIERNRSISNEAELAWRRRRS
ncbi:MAG: hypothetical protein ACRDFX_04235 [Chloroflexota bacterium]